MASLRSELHVTASSTDYYFPISVGQNGREIAWQARPWQAADPRQPFRIPLFPWDGGLGPDRLGANPRTYKAANADVTVPGLLLFPPKYNTSGSAGDNGTKGIVFAGKYFAICGRYCYYFTPGNPGSWTQDKDFGSGKAAVDLAVFNDELIVAMGESEKIWKRSSAGTWTQATDATYAIALGTIGRYLWRAESTNKLSSCLTTPLTLTNWTPTSGSQYVCGDSSYAIHTILDYNGAMWVFKGDGAYTRDQLYRFENQTPQIKQWPDSNNCKGAFVAHGSLWVPSISSMYRIRLGSSIAYGPELSRRPSYQFRVVGGVEFAGDIYLLVKDMAGSANGAILKMVRSPQDPNLYYYHEWLRTGNTNNPGFIGIVSDSTYGATLVYNTTVNLVSVALGRGGGAQQDDSYWDFGTDMVLETGPIRPGPDLSIVSVLQGVETLLDYSAAGESLTVAAAVDGGAYSNLLDTQEGGGSAAISSTTNWQAVFRYAAVDTTGQFFEFKFTGTLTSASGTNRPEIREAWAVGFLRPKMTDLVNISIRADSNAFVGMGVRPGLSIDDIERLWRSWCNSATIITARLDRYEEGHTNRFLVSDVQVVEEEATMGPERTVTPIKKVVVSLVRIPFGPQYASAT